MARETTKPASTKPSTTNRDAAELLGLWRDLTRVLRPPRTIDPDTGRTPRMDEVLLRLASAGPQTLSELARAQGTSPVTMTEIVDRLERGGHVTRIRDDADRRRVLVWLTTAGRKQARAATKRASVSLDPAQDVITALDPADRRALLRGLRAMQARVSRETTI